MPKLTVYTAHGGTEADNGTSFAGHMFYTLTDDNGVTHSFGFAPDSAHTGKPFAPGAVYTDDVTNYQPLIHSAESVNISQADYDTLMGFGTPGSANYMQGFNSYYNVVSNSCIDFTWAALSQIGIAMPSHVPGTDLLPSWNAKPVDEALSQYASAHGEVAQKLDNNNYMSDGGYYSGNGYGYDSLFYGYDLGSYGYSGGYDGGYGGYYGYYGYYGLAGDRKKIAKTLGKGEVDAAASHDHKVAGDVHLVSPQELHKLYELSMSDTKAGTDSVVLEAAKWDQSVITWSLADGPGSKGAEFSSYMSPEEEAAVRAAFATWAAVMPGVKFQEVQDSTASDIRIGFGKFDTKDTGVVGVTTVHAHDGTMLSNTIVRVEDPGETQLSATNGGETYTGTDATLTQVLTHEIGHALGLDDNADPNSIMYYRLGQENTTLDKTDRLGIQAVYGQAPGSSVGTSGKAPADISPLIQAMASFDTGTSAGNSVLRDMPTEQHIALSISPQLAR